MLNEFYEEEENKGIATEKDDTDGDDNDEDDITNQLSIEINKAKQESKDKACLFQAVDSGSNGVSFIRTSVENHYDLGIKIIRKLAELKTKRSRFTNRLLPIESVCKANVEDITDSAGKLFDKHFLRESSTFSIIFNKRLNNSIHREEIIKQLADLVVQKNIGNKVNLKNPEKTILVEVIKGLCLLTVLPDYLELKRFNLNELWIKKDIEKNDPTNSDQQNQEDDTIKI